MMLTGKDNRLTGNRPSSVIGAMTFASLAVAVAIGAMSMLTAGNANAMPFALVNKAAVATAPILVRDECGRGMRFSNRRQRCVEISDRARQRDDEDRGFRSERRQRAFRGDCGPGRHFSERRGRCVRNRDDRGDDDAAAAAAAIIDAIGNNNDRRRNRNRRND